MVRGGDGVWRHAAYLSLRIGVMHRLNKVMGTQHRDGGISYV